MRGEFYERTKFVTSSRYQMLKWIDFFDSRGFMYGMTKKTPSKGVREYEFLVNINSILANDLLSMGLFKKEDMYGVKDCDFKFG